MAAPIDLRQYDPVADRVADFYRAHPAGSIRTEVVRLSDGIVVFRAEAFRDPADPRPVTGWAYDRETDAAAPGAAVFSSCEACAVGRALANLGFAGARRPTREEMAKAIRLRAAPPVFRGALLAGATRAASASAAGTSAAGTGASIAEAGGTAEDRIREWLRGLRLGARKRQRILDRLARGVDAREAGDLEAYLLALRVRGR